MPEIPAARVMRDVMLCNPGGRAVQTGIGTWRRLLTARATILAPEKEIFLDLSPANKTTPGSMVCLCRM